MKVVIQRVKRASVAINEKVKSEVGNGLLVLVGIEESDDDTDIEWLSNKIVQLRIFDDSNGVMNLSAAETGKEIMIVSQFTLHASTKKGNRPSYIRAAGPDQAAPLYNSFIARTEELLGRSVSTGVFGAMMEVRLINDGPVTIFIDSRNRE